MNKEDDLKLLQGLTLKTLTVVMMQGVNFKPHPYVIGTGHVGYAADHYNGMLSEDAIRDAERHGIHCAQRGCRLPYDQHTYDRAVFVRPTTDIFTYAEEHNGQIPEDTHDDLLALKTFVETNKIRVDGFAFLDPSSEEKAVTNE